MSPSFPSASTRSGSSALFIPRWLPNVLVSTLPRGDYWSLQLSERQRASRNPTAVTVLWAGVSPLRKLFAQAWAMRAMWIEKHLEVWLQKRQRESFLRRICGKKNPKQKTWSVSSMKTGCSSINIQTVRRFSPTRRHKASISRAATAASFKHEQLQKCLYVQKNQKMQTLKGPNDKLLMASTWIFFLITSYEQIGFPKYNN